MNIFKLAEKGIKKFKWYDISVLKISVLTATLFLVTAWPSFRNAALSVEWYWYLLITFILSGYLLQKIFSK